MNASANGKSGSRIGQRAAGVSFNLTCVQANTIRASGIVLGQGEGPGICIPVTTGSWMHSALQMGGAMQLRHLWNLAKSAPKLTAKGSPEATIPKGREAFLVLKGHLGSSDSAPLPLHGPMCSQ